MMDLPPIAQRITDLTDDLNKALAIANATPGLVARASTTTINPGSSGEPWRVTVTTSCIWIGAPAAATVAAP